MLISNNLLAELTIQDIISANSNRAAKSSFNTLFDTENMVNSYVMDSNFLLTCHCSEKRKNSSTKDNTS